MNKKLLRNDILLILSLLMLIGILAFFIYQPSESNNITIMYDNKAVCELALNKDTKYVVADTGVTVRVEDGKAYIEDSDCPDKLCIDSAPIDKHSNVHSSIVCLPNRVAVVKRNGDFQKEADSIAG